MLPDPKIRYLRVSLLSSCNLHCFYCRPPGSKTLVDQSENQFNKYCKAIELLYRKGVRKIRFTGGEPTLYRNLSRLIAFSKSIDKNIVLAMTSNGLMLNRLGYELAEAGLETVNISLDTLSQDKFKHITGVDALCETISGIETAKSRFSKVKLNCVLLNGLNSNEAADMVTFASELGIDIRFIEFMPTKQSPEPDTHFISGDTIRRQLPWKLTPTPQAKENSAACYYEAPELNIKVGFINPVSHSFCAGCDRMRLASDGNLYGCLFDSQSINLFELLEEGFDRADKKIQTLVDNKQFIGCTPGTINRHNLPSFIRMGG